MRQQNQSQLGPKLPKVLLDQIGNATTSSGQRNAPGRKERRKQQRQDQKAGRRQQPAPYKQLVVSQVRPVKATASDGPSRPSPARKASQQAEKDEEAQPLKSILKQTKPKPERQPVPDVDETPIKPISRGVKDRLQQDDAEIAALERKLGIRSRKGSKRPADGGDDFDALLDGLDDDEVEGNGVKKRKLAEDEEWLEQKRRKMGKPAALGELDESSEDENNLDSEGEDVDDILDSDEDIDDVEEADTDLEEGDVSSNDEQESDENDFSGLESEEDQPKSKPKVKENPYVAPTTGKQEPAAKYVPPSLRTQSTSDTESLQRLRRRVQGLINRLSEANLLSIVQSMEELYQSEARQHVSSVLIDLLIGLVCDRDGLSDTFLILHAGFITALYRIIGTDFGAQVVERIVTDFDKHFDDKTAGGKELPNLLSLLAMLYNFNVIGSTLIFDYIRTLLQHFSESSTELLLRIIRTSGPQLRQDDPSALKDTVVMMQKAVAGVGGEASLTVRQKFMIETINALKNNRMKTGVVASSISAEHTTRMRKTLGALNTRTVRATEPLRISLADIRDTSKKGKWWLVGASWLDPAKADGTASTATTTHTTSNGTAASNINDDNDLIIEDDGQADLQALAHAQRMNTSVRRAVFIALLSASDIKDAHTRLLKLHLKKKQETEIPRVLLHCAGGEKVYNPYYTLIARRLCEEKRLRMAFQFSLWDLFKSMGERFSDGADDDRSDGSDADDDYDGEESDDAEGGGARKGVSMRKILDLGKFYGTLIAADAMPITILKVLGFAYLRPKTKLFVEVTLVTAMLEGDKTEKKGLRRDVWSQAVAKAKNVPDMVVGLGYFIETTVMKSGIVSGKVQKRIVEDASLLAIDILTRQVVEDD